ncbi:MAG: stage 0 sporulation family protein [Firmicutes bacterium]|nr:stage 0 sporulation family protein [Bacillota bacterium]HAL63372.1 stage 0 sporulation protein [Clostridiales bacterium]
MTKIVGVRFKPVGKIYHFNPAGLNINKNDYVVVETARGIELGKVVVAEKEISEEQITKPLKDVIRIATEEDLKTAEENKQKEKEAFDICLEKIKKHGLEMKLIEVEYTFDGSKILFYFSADGRIDFRELVKDLATVFHTRIELRQIGIRDESKTLGAVGVCGRELCCAKFLDEFESVSIKMAKEQGLSLNPTKISGTCGRLMCCLKYEQNTYEELLKITPRQGALVKTPDGQGIVEYVEILKGKVKVRIEEKSETALSEYDVKDIKILKKAKNDNKSEKNDEEILKTLED